MASRGDVENRIKHIIANKLGVEERQVVPEANLKDDLGADSLDVVELVMEFEKLFELRIPDEDAEKIMTVGEAVEYVAGKVAT